MTPRVRRRRDRSPKPVGPARRPVTGAEKVARFLVGVAEKGGDLPGLRIEVAEVNGQPALVGWVDTEPFGSISLTVAEGRIEQVLVVVNPDKLAGLAVHLGSAG